MPNPAWVLTNAEADSFVAQAGALPRMPPKELSNNLGYRGLVANVTQGPERSVVRIQDGAVEIIKNATNIYARDEGRRFERWLLETGKPHFEKGVFELVDLR